MVEEGSGGSTDDRVLVALALLVLAIVVLERGRPVAETGGRLPCWDRKRRGSTPSGTPFWYGPIVAVGHTAGKLFGAMAWNHETNFGQKNHRPSQNLPVLWGVCCLFRHRTCRRPEKTPHPLPLPTETRECFVSRPWDSPASRPSRRPCLGQRLRNQTCSPKSS